MPLDVNDPEVRELYGRIVLGGARLEVNIASLLAWLQTPRMTSPDAARRANKRMTFVRIIEQCRLCLAIREDDGVIEQEVADRLRSFLDKADRARVLRNRFVHASTVIIDEAEPDIRGAVDFIGDHAVTATREELEDAGRVIDDAGSDAHLARMVAEYQMGPRPWG
ncbi:hypothetical protein [Micromonospora inositola]|nr:hypothetical protein [Micromonospora inositola]